MKPDLHLSANGLDFACLERGSGPLALVLHGFPDTPVSFVPLLEALAEAGYHAVAPWMRGYAPTSIAADEDYSVPALVADAAALHEALGGGPDAVIIGHDWGASASYAAAIAHPDRWAKTVVMSVPPPPYFTQNLMTYEQLKRSFYMWLFQLGIAEKVVSSREYAFLESLWRDWSPSYDPTEALVDVRRALATPDHVTAAIGYYRSTFGAYRLGAPRRTETPVPPKPARQPGLYLHGVEDGCIAVDAGLLARITGAFGEGSFCEHVEGAGHFLVNEQPEVVSKRIVEFLRD
ncbi:alpha/beta fold hydrolase [Blastococcus sp. Marseille-P5729]|uniref:alpha/beta fold hydrolase n=1 Tax=Blastococcus sp. Marseille-P5729 TaxID=2086582 RepID=UPI000D0ED843|nr:alpha/beta hydrolase [Blastococcus sp. Marseille-P5729]